MLQICFHGTGAGTPSGDRGASAASLRFDEGSVLLLDAGEGCSRGMLRDGVRLNDVNVVAVSHMHPDHWAGLPNLVVGWAIGKRGTPVDLYLPPGSTDFFRTVLRTSYVFPERLGFELGFHELCRLDLPDGWRLRPFRTSHLDKQAEHAERLGLPFPAFAYAVEKGDRKILFSQDLGSEEDLTPELHGAELLVCELAHIDPVRIISLAKAAGVGRVIFTHVEPDLPAMPVKSDDSNDIQWSIAADGMILAL